MLAGRRLDRLTRRERARQAVRVDREDPVGHGAGATIARDQLTYS
jgi:hypothetical protein